MYRINASLIKTERDFIFAVLGVVFTEAKKKLGEDHEKVLKPLNRITKKYLYILSPPENGLYDSIEELTAAESYHTVESDFIMASIQNL
ncbi:MAG: hypothetical protein J6I84_04355 [Bacilli bacterium]|nr:hypothetical protein [Bacilli bacterium]